jgi:hypothetical protein
LKKKNDANDELITFNFTLDNNNFDLNFLKNLKIGIVKLNVTKNWVILMYELSSYNSVHNYHYQGICNCEYDFSMKNRYYLKKRNYTLVREKASQPRVTWITDIQKVENCTLKNSDFTLSAYGLQEPLGINPPIYHKIIRYVLIIAGLILILVGLYMKFLAKRMK